MRRPENVQAALGDVLCTCDVRLQGFASAYARRERRSCHKRFSAYSRPTRPCSSPPLEAPKIWFAATQALAVTALLAQIQSNNIDLSTQAQASTTVKGKVTNKRRKRRFSRASDIDLALESRTLRGKSEAGLSEAGLSMTSRQQFRHCPSFSPRPGMLPCLVHNCSKDRRIVANIQGLFA